MRREERRGDAGRGAGARASRDAGERLALGLSSGTSADGVDAALVALSGAGDSVKAELRAFACAPYPEALRRELLRLGSGGTASLEELARLDVAVAEWFARAGRALLDEAGVGAGQLAFAGSHGQTVAHHPEKRETFGFTAGATWQLGSISVIAERLGVTTAGNFRARDVAAGGEGAPLLPWVDWLLYRKPDGGRLLLNIGGIANVTFLPAGGGEDSVTAFDTGPGNMVVDGVVAALGEAGESCDRDGRRAARGRVDEDLLAQLLAHPFFDRPPPRSTGRETFGGAYLRDLLEAGRRRALSADDVVATATALTARSIAREIARWGPAGDGSWPRLHLSGGGGENPVLVRWLREALRPMEVRSFDELGIPSRAREAVSFAVLAHACLAGRPANLPRVTGASARVVLGEIAPGGEA